MAAQNKLKRLLLLIEHLHPPGRTKAQLAKFLGKTVRTVERYFTTLEEVGFEIEKDEAKRFYIFQPISKDLTVKLSQEEGGFLSDLIGQTASQHPLSTTIQAKLFYNLESGKIVKDNFRKSIPRVIQQLSKAMKLNRQVEILQYYSASSGKIQKTRVVEPLTFSEKYKYLLCYELEVDKFINLKLDRISKIEVLEEKCTHKPEDIKGVDIFQIAGNDENHEVELLLTPLAFRLLLEEHPSTESLISKHNDRKYTHCLKTTVFNFLPIGRFCLGLPMDVKVKSPKALKKYLLEKVRKNSW